MGSSEDYFLGVDPSINGTGVCVINTAGDVVCRDTLAPPKKYRTKATKIKRLMWIRENFQLTTDLYPITMAAIEEGAFSRRGQLFSLGEVAGMLKVDMAATKAPLFILSPTQVKKFLTNDGRADKDKMVETATKLTSLTGLTDDEADAYCLARAARLAYLYHSGHAGAAHLVRHNEWLYKTLTSLHIHRP